LSLPYEEAGSSWLDRVELIAALVVVIAAALLMRIFEGATLAGRCRGSIWRCSFDEGEE
jgi:hypothetical protein